MIEKIKILAIGAGGLQRALTHQFIDELNKKQIYDGKIFVAQPRGTEKADAFNQQKGVYHIVIFDSDGVQKITQINSVVGATTLSTEKGREKFYQLAENELDLILVGVTEAGIAKGEIGIDVLDELLFRYFQNHGSNSTICVICTDNIRNNGEVLREIILNDYPFRSNNNEKWLSQNVKFLDEMGDRIVPQSSAIPEKIRSSAESQINDRDNLITYTEKMPLISFVVQDKNGDLRVPFDRLKNRGIVTSPDSIDPHHDWKLLLINSVHVPCLTHKGFLSEIESVNDAANHQIFGPHLENLMHGYAKIVDRDIPIEGRRAIDYTLNFVDRIRKIEDSNARINVNETIKLRERAADIVRSPNYHTATDQFKNEFAYSVATVLRFLTPIEIDGENYFGKTDLGKRYKINDPNRIIQQLLKFGSDLKTVKSQMIAIFSNGKLWTPIGETEKVDLSRNRDFIEKVTKFYHALINGKTCLELLIEITKGN